MSYQVLARKWRPRRFDDVVGQAPVVRALANALDSDRIHHAFLFTGTRGVGKTTIARILAKCLNCEAGVRSQPCGVCSACREVDSGRFVDLIEVDAASRTKVEDTRDLLDNVPYAPAKGRFKVYLIDEVHMLSTHSFNALLKTLEEPPPHVKFLLATTDPQKLPVTILSRCLQFNLKRLPSARIAEHLARITAAEEAPAEPGALRLLAQSAEGSVRDALSLLDQAISFGGGQVRETEVAAMLGTIDPRRVGALAEALAAGDGARLLRLADELEDFVPDYGQVLAELAALLQRIAVAQVVPEVRDEDEDPLVRTLAASMAPEDVQLYYQIAVLGRRDLDLVPEPRTGFSMCLLRMLAFRPAAPVPDGDVQAGSRGTPAAPSKSRPREATVTDSSAPAAAGRMQDLRTRPWAETVERLGLAGMTAQLAVNATVLAWDDDLLTLALAPVYERLVSESRLTQLGAALSLLGGRPVRVRVSVGAVGDETPAARRQRVAAERLRAAASAIEADPNVRRLKESFGASVVPESVRPVDGE